MDVAACTHSKGPTINEAFGPEVTTVLVETVLAQLIVGIPAHVVLQTRDHSFVLIECCWARRFHAVVSAVLVALWTILEAAEEITAARFTIGASNLSKTRFNLVEACVEEAILVNHVRDLIHAHVVPSTLNPSAVDLGTLWVTVAALLIALLGNRIVWTLCLRAHINAGQPSRARLNRGWCVRVDVATTIVIVVISVVVPTWVVAPRVVTRIWVHHGGCCAAGVRRVCNGSATGRCRRRRHRGRRTTHRIRHRGVTADAAVAFHANLDLFSAL